MKIIRVMSWFFITVIVFIGMTFTILSFPFIRQPYPQKVFSHVISFIMNISLIIEGVEDENTEMFLINHESDMDAGCMESITKKNLAWVAKKSLFDVPFFGLFISFPDNIAIERENKTSLLKMLKDSKDRLSKGRVIAIFPEGTRSIDGKMRKFKPGAKLVADKLKLRVQPVVLINTASYYDVQRRYYKSGNIKVIFLKAFDADKNNKNWLNDTREKMQNVYDEEFKNINNYR